MKIKSLTAILLLSISIVGYSQSLSGKIFEIGSKRDCKPYNECDCCASDLYFINETQFAWVDYCLGSDSFETGTYRVNSKTLTLNFKQVRVRSGEDYDANDVAKPFIGIKNEKINHATLKIAKCENGALMFEINNEKETYFGLRKSNTGESVRTKELLNSEEWKLLSQ